MDVAQIYSISTGASFVIFIILNIFPTAWVLDRFRQVLRWLIYPYLVRRHLFIGPWTPIGVLIHLVFIAVNAFCLGFRWSSLANAGIRAANMSLANMTILFVGSHLNLISDWLGFALCTLRTIHRSVAFMCFVLLVFHVVTVVINGTAFPIRIANNIFTLIASVSISVILVFSQPCLRQISYEIFLRSHQALAMLSIYGIWRHLPSEPLFPKFYIYIILIMFSTMSALSFGALLNRNGCLLGRGFPHAILKQAQGSVKMLIVLPRGHGLNVQAGQYINIWMPFLTYWSLSQSHPFVVTSWAEGSQNVLELYVEPRKGLTNEICRVSETAQATQLVLFTGPYGISVPVSKFGTILMVATGSGIAAVLPYLKKLVYGFNSPKGHARRVHLVWQLQSTDTGIARQALLNDVLDDDILGGGYMLTISVYLETGKIVHGEAHFGEHDRARVYEGRANLGDIMRNEVSGAQQISKKDKILVMVSASEKLRDHVRQLVKIQVKDNVRLCELDYQP